MQNLQETSEKIFLEIKKLSEELTKTNSYQELLSKETEIIELYQQFSFLKISQNFEWNQTNIDVKSVSENHNIIDDFDTEETTFSSEENVEATETIEVIFDNTIEKETVEISFTESEETLISTEESTIVSLEKEIDSEDEPIIEESEKLEPMSDSQFSFAMEKEPEHEHSNNVVNETKEEIIVEKEFISEKEQLDKKIKLATIKGINTSKTLFDDIVLEEEITITETKTTIVEQTVITTLQEVVEAPRTIKDFKLDLNDRLAFSQYLFGGSQSELNEVVAKLNSFDNVDKAQAFLSDIYYAKGWEKADSYAQRLWSLVENKFL